MNQYLFGMFGFLTHKNDNQKGAPLLIKSRSLKPADIFRRRSSARIGSMFGRPLECTEQFLQVRLLEGARREGPAVRVTRFILNATSM